MVSSMDITKIGVRDRVVIDLKVEMDGPDDHQFQPRVHLDGNMVRITNEGYSEEFVSAELDDDVLVAAQRDRFVELRVKFSVAGRWQRQETCKCKLENCCSFALILTSNGYSHRSLISDQ
jgi:hypothetical protein